MKPHGNGKGRGLSIAIIGTRGVPPRYGGFETFAAELGRRLAERGHRPTVYCRSKLYGDVGPIWEGIERIELPAIGHKYLETVTHTFLSAIDALRREFDVALLCNAANAFALPILKLARIPVAINVDGIERKRAKWNLAGRAVYQIGESMSVRFSDRVVGDADVIADYYANQYGAEAVMIPYGSEFPDEEDSDILQRLSLERQGYILYVSRMEPENNPLAVVEAYRKARPKIPLVMVGSAPYSSELLAELNRKAGDGVILTGGLYGADYRTLQRQARVYVQATEVGGTHPALIEGMASGGAVFVLETAENREVGGDSVFYFQIRPKETLSNLFENLLDDSSTLNVYRSKARDRARSKYSWGAVTDAYERLFLELTGVEESRRVEES
jgi:glycosyltransferase involved in cell wall biosynthesis